MANMFGSSLPYASWPEANATALITIVHDEFIKGNIKDPNYTLFPPELMNIMHKMGDACPGYKYSAEQLKGKFMRIKYNWYRYHIMLKSNAGFGWDDEIDMLTGSDECLVRWIGNDQYNVKDLNLRGKRCPHYRKLTAMFAPDVDEKAKTPTKAPSSPPPNAGASYKPWPSNEVSFKARKIDGPALPPHHHSHSYPCHEATTSNGSCKSVKSKTDLEKPAFVNAPTKMIKLPSPRTISTEDSSEGSSFNSFSVTSSPPKRQKLANMFGGASGNARWPEANVSAFITIMYDEFLKGNIMKPSYTITHYELMNIMNKMRDACPGYEYSTEQLKRKYFGIKYNWDQYDHLLVSNSGFGWDDANDMVTASDECWDRYLEARNYDPKAVSLRSKGCPHYRKLTAMFTPVSEKANKPPTKDPVSLGEKRPFEDGESGRLNDEMELGKNLSPSPPGSSPRQVATSSSSGSKNIGTTNKMDVCPAEVPAIYSREIANENVELEIIRDDMMTVDMCVKKLNEMADVSPEFVYSVCRKLEKPVRRRFFLALKPELRCGYIESL